MPDLTERIVGVLIATAAARSTLTYARLATLIGLRIDWASDRRQLGEYLNEVADISKAELGVILPVLVVGKGGNIPRGSLKPDARTGFWAWCRARGLDMSDPSHLVLNEQRKVYDRFAV